MRTAFFLLLALVALAIAVALVLPREVLDRPPPPDLLAEPGRLTVAEAYAAIPHRRTPFDPSTARMERDETVFLARLFSLTDQAMAAKVQALAHAPRGDTDAVLDLYATRAERITAEISRLATPEGLGETRRLVADAIREQARYFADWRKAGRSFPHRPNARFREHPAVRKSSDLLKNAYRRLVGRYGNGAPNRNAFFDHLCALDFI